MTCGPTACVDALHRLLHRVAAYKTVLYLPLFSTEPPRQAIQWHDHSVAPLLATSLRPSTAFRSIAARRLSSALATTVPYSRQYLPAQWLSCAAIVAQRQLSARDWPVCARVCLRDVTGGTPHCQDSLLGRTNPLDKAQASSIGHGAFVIVHCAYRFFFSPRFLRYHSLSLAASVSNVNVCRYKQTSCVAEYTHVIATTMHASS